MCIMSCLSCLESRPFWQHWKTLCLVSFVAGLRWFVHVHGSWITLQALQQMEWTLVWLQVKCLSWSSAGEMDMHQSDHLECHQSLKGHCFQLHHQLPPSSSCCDPTGTHQEELLLQAGPVLMLSLLPSPVPQLFAGRVLAPSQGTGKTQDRGTLLFILLPASLRGREDGACGCHPFLEVKISLAVEHSDCYKLSFICILSVCMRYELYIFIEVKVIKSLC